MSTLKLSIIIVHYRTPVFLKLCLDSIATQVTDIAYEVIVVDSCASRESGDIVKAFEQKIPHIQYHPFTHNTGYAHGVNAGLKAAQGHYMLVLNPDTIIKDDAVQKMLTYMQKHEDVGLLGPQMLHFNGNHQQNYFRFYTPLIIAARRTPLGRLAALRKRIDAFLMRDTNPHELQTPDWLMGSALMTRRSAVEKVGMMDERFFMYFEDVDWARRFWHNGYNVVYYPDAILYHYHQRESKSRFGIFDVVFNRKTRWHIISAIKFFRKYRTLAVYKNR